MRMKGHAEHDDARYVPKALLEAWRKKDPITSFERYLRGNRLMSEEEKAGIDARLEEEMRAELEFAETSPFPSAFEAAHATWA